MKVIKTILPREHGTTVIWFGTLIFSIILIISQEMDYTTFSLNLIWLILVLATVDPLMDFVKRKRKNFPVLNTFMMMSILLVIIYLKFSFELIYSLIPSSLMFLGWCLTAFRKKILDTVEIALGAATLSLLIPFVVISSTTLINSSFGELLFISWLYAIVSVLLVLHVDFKRKKISKNVITTFWFIMLGVTALFWWLIAPGWAYFLALVEPTFSTVYNHITFKDIQDNNISLKKIGRIVSLRLLIFIIVASIVYYLA